MPFVPVPNAILAEMRYRLADQQVENTLWFRADAAPEVYNLADIANMLLTWWNTTLRLQQSGEISLFEIALSWQDEESGPGLVVPAPTPNPTGAVNQGSAPNNVALAVSFRTARRGRSFRGRNFVAGLPKDNIVNSRLSAVTAGNIVAAYEDLITEAQTQTLDWCVCSRYSNGAPRASGVLEPIVSVGITDNVVDSQRRRLPGRGS